MKKSFFEKIIPILIVLVVILGILQLFLSGSISAYSVEVGSIEERLLVLEKENQSLEEKIARNSSLPVIQARAIDLGFGTPSFLRDYSSEEPVALNR